MAEQGKHGISWCTTTWNPIRGCSRVSEGCRNCYAERVAARFSGPGMPYEGLAVMHHGEPRWTGKVRFIEEKLLDPLRWKRPRLIFVNSMSDLFHEEVPDEWIDKIFDVMLRAQHHKFQILTKRPRRMRDYVGPHLKPVEKTLPHVWFGVSVEDQETADERIPLLLKTPAAVRWVSYEPALGPVTFRKWLDVVPRGKPRIFPLAHTAGVSTPLLDWIVCGGESGPKARPMNPEWARAARDQCVAAGVPFHFKQFGEWSPDQPKNYCKLSEKRYSYETFAWGKDGEKYNPLNPAPDDFPKMMWLVGKRAAGRVLDGRTWDEYPEAR